MSCDKWKVFGELAFLAFASFGFFVVYYCSRQNKQMFEASSVEILLIAISFATATIGFAGYRLWEHSQPPRTDFSQGYY